MSSSMCGFADRRRRMAFLCLAAVIVAALLLTAKDAAAQTYQTSNAWRFGVLSDTQWTVTDSQGKNPNTVPANLMGQIDQQFINKGVKVVVDIGDSVDTSSTANLDARALMVQDLYNAGIGYYPLRGNHEATDPNSGAEFSRTYPQIGYTVNPTTQTGGTTGTAGVNNATPSDIVAKAGVGLDTNYSPPAKTNPNTFTVGSNFSYPTSVNNANGSVSYSLDYNNTRFVLLDQFEASDSSTNASSIAQQQPWINTQLSTAKASGMQTFVFGHKNLLGGNHKDNLFGPNIGSSDPGDGYGVNTGSLSPSDQAALAAKQAEENSFIGAMAGSNAKYYISGHDHHDNVSIVTSPDGSASTHQIISQSDSSKFYTPGAPYSANETPIAQQLNSVGYYTYTVDGPRVTVNYYAAPASALDSTGTAITSGGNPTYNFTLQQTFGYSLNGKEVLVPQGGSYKSLTDNTNLAIANGETGYFGTTASILDGVNGSTLKTSNNIALTKAVDTGWAPGSGTGLASDVLTLWGMTDIAATSTDKYTLSMSYKGLPGGLAAELASWNGAKWVNAADLNVGGSEHFVLGAYNPAADFNLGWYGYDPSTDTAWAVVNNAGDFAVQGVPEPSSIALLGIGIMGMVLWGRRRRTAMQAGIR